MRTQPGQRQQQNNSARIAITEGRKAAGRPFKFPASLMSFLEDHITQQATHSLPTPPRTCITLRGATTGADASGVVLCRRLSNMRECELVKRRVMPNAQVNSVAATHTEAVTATCPQPPNKNYFEIPD